jgi:hypothetical protein
MKSMEQQQQQQQQQRTLLNEHASFDFVPLPLVAHQTREG